MVSQLHFGETFKVLEESGLWLRIQADYDYYEGWVPTIQTKALSEAVYKAVIKNNAHYSDEMVTFITDKNDQLQILSLGASLPFSAKSVRSRPKLSSTGVFDFLTTLALEPW